MGKEKVYRAGVIPFYVKDGKISMLFMRPSNEQFGGSHWQIAKGHIEENESKQKAAFREANEELGLFEGNIINKHDLGNFLGRTQIYLAEIKDQDMFGDYDDETGAVQWMTIEEFKSSGRELHYPIVKAAVRWITKDKKLN